MPAAAAMARPGSAVTWRSMPAARQAACEQLAAHSVMVGAVLALDVGDAEAAADVQLRQAERATNPASGLDLLLEAVQQEDLAADVGVDADEVEPATRRCARAPGPPRWRC